MYSPAVISLFEQVKAVFDPADVLNPGVLVRPVPLDDDIRMAAAPVVRKELALAYRHDGGDLSAAVHRCTGVGKCRADLQSSGGVMCPSWPATREEKDSTRGRARVLQEMLAPGGPVTGWRSPEVHDALDLCLSCKGCSSDCPTGVDMASYKAEVLHQSYRRRLRPRPHYTLGWLPRWADLAARAPRVVNAVLGSRLGGRLAKWGAGMDQRREVPPFAVRTFRQQWADRSAATRDGAPVALWVDSFTDHFDPDVAMATAEVLEGAGYRVQVPGADTCCGLTWITTGQLDAARW
jgi:Fe-S oxidoreductase